MTWTRLSDDFTDRPEMLRISRSARLLHIEAMVWCNRMGQDGRIPAAAIRRITDAEDPAADITELAKEGIWRAIEGEPDLWQLDWSDQEPAAEVQARAEHRAATQKRYRERKGKHERGDHSMCDKRFCSHAVTDNATGNESDNETPSRPVPSRPEDRGQGQGARARPAGAGEPGAAAEDPLWVTHWPQTPDAHPFIENEDNDECAWEDDDRDCCRPRKGSQHGHHWQPTSETDRACVVCDMPRWHGIHFDRRFSDPATDGRGL